MKRALGWVAGITVLLAVFYHPDAAGNLVQDAFHVLLQAGNALGKVVHSATS